MLELNQIDVQTQIYNLLGIYEAYCEIIFKISSIL